MTHESHIAEQHEHNLTELLALPNLSVDDGRFYSGEDSVRIQDVPEFGDTPYIAILDTIQDSLNDLAESEGGDWAGADASKCSAVGLDMVFGWLPTGDKWLLAIARLVKVIGEDQELYVRVLSEMNGYPLSDLPFDEWSDNWPVIDGDLNLTGDYTDSSDSGDFLNYDDEAMIARDDAVDSGWDIDSDGAYASPRKEKQP